MRKNIEECKSEREASFENKAVKDGEVKPQKRARRVPQASTEEKKDQSIVGICQKGIISGNA